MRLRICPLQRDDLALAAYEAVLTRTCAPNLLSLLIENRILDIKPDTRISRDFGTDHNGVAVLCHGLVFSGKSDDGAYDPHLFHSLISQSYLLKELGPCLFEPSDVVRMMGNPHLICLVILYEMLAICNCCHFPV